MVWAGLSGMEVPLYAALATLAMLAYVRALDNPAARIGASGRLLAGLAGWARPETFVAATILGASRGFSAVPATRHPPARARAGGGRVLARRCSWRAFVAFNLYVGGRPLPNTFYAKNYGMGAAVSLAEGRPLDALHRRRPAIR